jgi:hypothetical protein
METKIIKGKNLRVIKTARDLASINSAAQNGFFPLVKSVKPNLKISSKYSVFQDHKTGEIEVFSDFRCDLGYKGGKKKVIDWTYYYPYRFPNPYAAYLIPHDLKAGQKVWIEDVIEDVVGSVWNQGDVNRLIACEAVWDGKDLELCYDENIDCTTWIG